MRRAFYVALSWLATLVRKLLAFVTDWSLAIYQDRREISVGLLLASAWCLFMAVFA